MRDAARIPVALDLIARYWQRNPDMRLGQMLCGLSAAIRVEMDPFYLEDDAMISYLERML